MRPSSVSASALGKVMFCEDELVVDVVGGEVVTPGEQAAGDGEHDGGDDAEADQDAVDRAPLQGDDRGRSCGGCLLGAAVR